jgi:hypothetical protein
MNQPRPRHTVRNLAALASALLWGLVEVVALARSRWALRLRHDRGLPSGSRRG